MRRIDESLVSGSYRFDDNRLLLDPDVPPLENVRGQIDFTQAGLSAKGVTAAMYGLPFKLELLRTAIMQKNPAAFKKGKPETMLAGAVLQLPTIEDFRRMVPSLGTASEDAHAKPASDPHGKAPEDSHAEWESDPRKGWVRFP